MVGTELVQVPQTVVTADVVQDGDIQNIWIVAIFREVCGPHGARCVETGYYLSESLFYCSRPDVWH